MLILVFVVSVIFLILKIRYEKKYSGKPFFSTVKETLLEEDEVFAVLCSLVILVPIYLFTYDLGLNVREYIAGAFIVLLICYIFKIACNEFLR